MGRRARRDSVRSDAAGRRVPGAVRHDPHLDAGAGRRLAHRQRVDAGPRRGRPAGDGVDPRRRLRERQLGGRDVRRAGLRPRRRRAGDAELPARGRGLRGAARRPGQPRPARPGSPPWSGCATTRPRSAATRRGSRCSASRPAP
nr:hypothetical protein [Angustibacter aerolatus]